MNDNFLPCKCSIQVIHLEGNVRNLLNKVRIWSVIPITLPLNPKRIALVI